MSHPSQLLVHSPGLAEGCAMTLGPEALRLQVTGGVVLNAEPRDPQS